MMKWWIEREGGSFDHVSADFLEVNSGALVFKRAVTMPIPGARSVPVLIVATGTYRSVHLDAEDEKVL